MADQADLEVAAKEVERVTDRIGAERVAASDMAVSQYVNMPLTERKGNPRGVASPPDGQVAVVGVDGGRYQRFDYVRPAKKTASATRSACENEPTCERPEPDAEHRGTHWREDKIALAMTMRSVVREHDPCPTMPKAFADPTRIVKLTRELKTKRSANASLEEQASPSQDPDEELNALGSSNASIEAPSEATPDASSPSTPARSSSPPVTQGWQPEVVEKHFTATRQAELGSPDANDGDTHPRVVVSTALGYLQKHKDKMRYAEYRRQGLPITSSYVESAVKQFNRRVKGTEKF